MIKPIPIDLDDPIIDNETREKINEIIKELNEIKSLIEPE